MLDFIIKYWVQFLCGVIATGLAVFSKKIIKLIKTAINKKIADECHKELELLKSEITQNIADLRTENQMQNEKTQIICDGVLNIYANQFKSYCRLLLQENYIITLDEFENCQNEYEMYKKMGGNGKGDVLYKLVLEKAGHNLADK